MVQPRTFLTLSLLLGGCFEEVDNHVDTATGAPTSTTVGTSSEGTSTSGFGTSTGDPSTSDPSTSSIVTTDSTLDLVDADVTGSSGVEEDATSSSSGDRGSSGDGGSGETGSTGDETGDITVCENPEHSDCGGPTCVDVSTHREHCGACNHGCDPGEICEDGECDLLCPERFIDCGGDCIDPRTDGRFCGASDTCEGEDVGQSCEGGDVCDNGVCTATCSNDLVYCEETDSCADLANDPDNCGSCGYDCGPGTACVSEECVCLSIDDDGDGLLNCNDDCPLDYFNDVDGDGVCGGEDLCAVDNSNGLATFPATGNVGYSLIYSNVRIDGGGNIATGVAPGSVVTVVANWAIDNSDSFCCSCVQQAYLGLAGTTTASSDPNACFSVNRGCPGATGTDYVYSITAPSVPGTYYLAGRSAWDLSCVPAELSTSPAAYVGALCVRTGE